MKGFTPIFPEPLEGFYDSPSMEPLAAPGLLEALANEASRVLFAVEVIWP
jgi:hypothetical protein